MNKKQTWFLIKFFGDEKHADQFIQGRLYLNRLGFFRKIEAADDDDGRTDEHEAVMMWWQPHEVIFKIKFGNSDEIELDPNDFAAPMCVSSQAHDYLHILCLYAVHTSGFKTIMGNLDLSPDEAVELQRQVSIDERCLKFGRYAVIVPAFQFLEHLKVTLQSRGHWSRGRLVEYYDDETFNGEIERTDVPFKKQKRFSYQQEFRICVQTNTQGDDPMVIDVGDISALCRKVQSSELNGFLQLRRLQISGSLDEPPLGN